MSNYNRPFPFSNDDQFLNRMELVTRNPAELKVLRNWRGRTNQDVAALNKAWRKERRLKFWALGLIALGVFTLWVATFTGGLTSVIFQGIGLFLTGAAVPVGIIGIWHTQKMLELHVQHFINMHTINTAFRFGEIQFEILREKGTR